MKQSTSSFKKWQNLSSNFPTENEGFLYNFRSFIAITLEYSWNTSISRYCCRKRAEELKKLCKEQYHFKGIAICYYYF